MQDERTFKNERLTYRLGIVSHEAIKLNDDIFLRETGCRIRDLRVLRLVDDSPGITFAEISKITGFEKSLTSRIIQNLIGSELIRRENSDQDARVFLLFVTERGKEVRQIGRKLSDQLDVILTDPLSAQELRTFNAILERLGSWVVSDDYRAMIEERTSK